MTLHKIKNFQTAIICYDNILLIDPKNLDALYNKGIAFEAMGQLDDAIDCFKKSLTIDSHFLTH